MAEIPLGRSKLVAVVDDADADRMSRFEWRFDGRYVVRYECPGGKQRKVYMHREILGREAGGSGIDHKSGDTLDNRWANLRDATKTQNGRNRARHATYAGKPTEGDRPKGVTRRPSGKWQSRIKVDGKNLTVGTFDTKEEAGSAYDDACRSHFGEFGRPNSR